MVDSSPQNCPAGYYCDNNLDNECSASVPPSLAGAAEDENQEDPISPEPSEVATEESVVSEQETEAAQSEDQTTQNDVQENTPESNGNLDEPTQSPQNDVAEGEGSGIEVTEEVPEGEGAGSGANEEITNPGSGVTEEVVPEVPEDTTESQNNEATEEPIPENPESPNNPENEPTTPENQESPIPAPEEPQTPPTPFECTSFGKFADPNDCHRYILCIWTPFGYLKFENICPLGESYDPIGKECLADLTLCDANDKPSQEVQEFHCQERGKFADPNNSRKYYACLVDPAGNLLKFSLTCPFLTVFNETAQKCTIELFPAPEVNDQESTGNNGAAEGEDPVPFTCVAEGTFPDPANNSYYYICKLKKKDKLKLKHKKCGKTQVFNPETLMCYDPTLAVKEEASESVESLEQS